MTRIRFFIILDTCFAGGMLHEKNGAPVWKYWIPEKGYAASGWYLLVWNGSERWYRFDSKGFMGTGWVQDPDGRRYYLEPESNGFRGAMVTGWRTIDGKPYYFREESPWQGELIQEEQ